MNCGQARELAALAASGDITAVEWSTLSSHTAMCAECYAEAAAFDALRGQLAAMREDSAPEHVYSAIRARVAAEIGRQRRPARFASWPALASVLLTCSLALVIALRRESPVVARPPALAGVVVAGIEPEAPQVFAPPPKRRVHRIVRRVAAPVPDEPLFVHMFTSDPDVVIYWTADAKQNRSKKESIQ